MCGIFAVTSSKKPTAAADILAGLKRLEYRGYDSWGIAVVNQASKLIVDKHTGKITNAHTNLPQAFAGIGHTRWATHGRVTQANAHPFTDCGQQIALVHNGIIDNYQGLKKLLNSRHQFSSETDSEILLHLIEQFAEEMDFSQAVRTAFNKAQGLNAILCIKGSTIVAAKTGSPLVIGIGKEANYLASDLWSLLDHTRKVFFLEDGQYAIVNSGHVLLKSLKSGREIKPKIRTINWQQQSATLGNHRYFMIKEIMQQPELIERLTLEMNQAGKKLAQLITKADQVFLVACGTAAYAAISGQYFFSKLANTQVNPAIGSEFIYYANLLKKNSLVIALSQSGETIDTIQSVKLAKEKQATIACLVNVLGSSLYRLSNYPILLEAGPEKAVASTKAFIAKISLLLLTAHHLNHQAKIGVRELKKAARAAGKVLQSKYLSQLKQVAKKIKDSKSIFVVGRGISYPSALETALKIKEISYIHAEGLASGELKHGPLALVEKNTPCIVIAPDDETYHDSISGAMEMKARGGLIIAITSKPHEVFDITLRVDDCGTASLIPSVIVGQLLAYQLAISRGLDPDKPRNLAKSVTVK